MTSNVDIVISKLTETKQRYWKKSEFYDFLKENDFSIDKTTLFQLMRKLDPNDADFQLLMADLVSDVAQDSDEFLNFVLDFAKIVSGKPVSDAKFFNSLAHICEQNPDLGLKLAERFLENLESSIFVYVSLCLGLVGRSKEKLVLSLNKKLLQSDVPPIKATGIRTLRIMYKETVPSNKDKIFQILLDNSKLEVDIGIRMEVLVGLFDMHRLDTELCNQTIHELIEQDVRLRLKVADTLQYWPLPNPHHTLDLIQHCINHEDYGVRKYCYYALTRLVKNFPTEIVGLIQQNIEDFGFDYGDATYLLEELGKKNFEAAMNLVSGWVDNNLPFRTRFHIPNIVNALIPKDNLSISLPYFEKWLEKEGSFELGLRIAKEVVSCQYKKSSDEEFLNALFCLLEMHASKRQLDLQKILKGEEDKILKCAQVIDGLLYFSIDLDYNLVFSNLKKYPNIESFIGKSWFEVRRDNNDKIHTLIRVLSRQSNPNDDAYLQDLDYKISKIVKHGQKLKKFRDGLIDHDQYDDTLAEMDFIVPFLDNYDVEIEPPINGKNLDVKIKFNSESVYVEIFSPDEFKPLRYLSGMMGIPNRVKKKIYDKYLKQISYLEGKHEPVIIAVDVGRSEVTCEDIENYIYGDILFSFLINTKTHETVGTAVRRSGEDMYNKEPHMKVISAIICYKSNKEEDGKYHLRGKLIKNPNTDNPLSEETEKKINTIFSN